MRKSIIILIAALTAALTFTSCSENNDEVEEFPNWEQANKTYWDNLYTATQQKIAAGDSTWKILINWSLENQTPTRSEQSKQYDNTNYIIVHVINKGTGSGCPMYTDSARVFYEGRLIPSTTYTSGYVFDATWTGPYNAASNRQATLAVNGVVDGFATALMHMHIGDRWVVYMPQTLGYGSTNNSTSGIPAYSNLIFDITLLSYYRPGATLPPTPAKPGRWIEQ